MEKGPEGYATINIETYSFATFEACYSATYSDSETRSWNSSTLGIRCNAASQCPPWPEDLMDRSIWCYWLTCDQSSLGRRDTWCFTPTSWRGTLYCCPMG